MQESIVVAPFNDIDATARIIKQQRDQLAAVIVEPVQRVIFPKDGFLEDLKNLCNMSNIILIFDEVVTGFRLAYGGAQEAFGVRPDLACLGKVMGGGMGVRCGGRA